nr:hypothetical protein L203_06461 [Cryptococcus depauperatus CBS 7841]
MEIPAFASKAFLCQHSSSKAVAEHIVKLPTKSSHLPPFIIEAESLQPFSIPKTYSFSAAPRRTHPRPQFQAMSRDSEFSYQNQPTDGGSDNNDRDITRLAIEIITKASTKLESNNSTLARDYWNDLGSEASVQTIISNVKSHVERRLGSNLPSFTSLAQITAKVPSVTCNEGGLNMVVQYYNQYNRMELGEVILLPRTV